MTPEQQRHQAQLAFVASGAELIVGRAEDCPLPTERLAATDGGEPYVRQRFPGGLTAHVYRIEADGRHWTLKRARERCLVQNVDGQTSFLNEVQRRADLQALKARPGMAEALSAVVDTCYASFRQGIILSPWIDGEQVRAWDERRLLELFDALRVLVTNGLFEWDLCPGNLLDDGHLRLFDFGYMYRFDPLTGFNSNGTATPQMHAAERFETRNYFAWLLGLEQRSETEALEAFRLEKSIALDCYRHLRHDLLGRGANATVNDWLSGIIDRWQSALGNGLDGLYLAEAWRSHRIDLADDLGGQTCTPLTLARIDWLEQAVHRHYADLRRLDAFVLEDGEPTAEALLSELREARNQAEAWQV
ncbi:hypothetical protein BZL41_26565 [Pseudomonas sp. PIC25]|uniref:hypothetical protein n=1 Tax=Pseudomonas sp. PIC25 TaxID=1958773 RepID=UPI000BAC05BF|nr:hypothetical protein [Pseudomonas sp. PIC25]PAU51687.1 hypothetical protein BZL41_26565 [Pseudomonas sp. PIC25]